MPVNRRPSFPGATIIADGMTLQGPPNDPGGQLTELHVHMGAAAGHSARRGSCPVPVRGRGVSRPVSVKAIPCRVAGPDDRAETAATENREHPSGRTPPSMIAFPVHGHWITGGRTVAENDESGRARPSPVALMNASLSVHKRMNCPGSSCVRSHARSDGEKNASATAWSVP